jgi:hypothetical protein
MLTILTVLLVSPPPNFTVARDTVKIEKVVWYDENGQRRVTEEPYLQIRLKVKNEADHPIRWPGFRKARVSYGMAYRSAVLAVSFGPGSRWENSLVTGQMVKPGQETTILVVFPVPKVRGPASLEVQWNGESPGWVMTVKSGFKLPEGN